MNLRSTTKRAAIIAATALLLNGIVSEAEAGPRSRPIRTGQTTCWSSAGNVVACAGTGQDGDLRPGEPRGYVDLGNGTIRDKRAGLTWEKLSDDGSIHDKDSASSWSGAFAKVATLNTPPCFAGFCDWRLPTRFELETLINLEVVNPSVSTAFNSACVPGCSVLTCSCTASWSYWTSSTFANNPAQAWAITFFDSFVGPDTKNNPGVRTRAVRGGL